MNKPPFGLDISDDFIKVVQLEQIPLSFRINKHKIRIKAFGKIELPNDAVSNGQIFKKRVVAKFLKKLLSTTNLHKIRTPYSILSLPDSRVFINFIQIPEKEEKQIAEEITWEVEKYIALPTKDVYLDWKIIGRSKDNLFLSIAAVPERIVKDLLDVLNLAGISPLALDLESQAIARTIINPKTKKNPLLIMDIGARTTTLSIFEQGMARRIIDIPIAGNDFTQAISNKLQIDSSRAENMKKTYGLNSTKAEKVAPILKRELKKIIFEIKDLITSYKKESQKEIDKIILCGASAKMPVLKDYLKLNLNLKIKLANPWENLKSQFPKKYFPPIPKKDAQLYITSLGLALRGLEKNPQEAGINLLPKGEQNI